MQLWGQNFLQIILCSGNLALYSFFGCRIGQISLKGFLQLLSEKYQCNIICNFKQCQNSVNYTWILFWMPGTLWKTLMCLSPDVNKYWQSGENRTWGGNFRCNFGYWRFGFAIKLKIPTLSDPTKLKDSITRTIRYP